MRIAVISDIHGSCRQPTPRVSARIDLPNGDKLGTIILATFR